MELPGGMFMPLREYILEIRDLTRSLSSLSLLEQEIPVPSHGPNIHFVGGFLPFAGNEREWFLHGRYYRFLRNYLVKKGARVYVSQIGVSYRNFYDTLNLIDKEREKIFGNKEPVLYVGHSLGGVIGIGALFSRPEKVSGVIGLATPTRNPPWHQFAKKIFACTGISEELFFKHENAILAVSEKITLISSPKDPIAPTCNCIIETRDGRRGKALHIDISKHFPGHDVTHSRIPFDSRVLSLVAELAQLMEKPCENK